MDIQIVRKLGGYEQCLLSLKCRTPEAAKALIEDFSPICMEELLKVVEKLADEATGEFAGELRINVEIIEPRKEKNGGRREGYSQMR